MVLVNLIKLTKLERKVLLALSKPTPQEKCGYYPSEGNNVKGIAKCVYGEEVLDCESRGGYYVQNLGVCYAAKSSLSRVLKRLWEKGLVKKCKPIYESFWMKAGTGRYGGPGYWRRQLMYLKAVSIISGRYHVEEVSANQLPDRTHIWWMLTEKGKEGRKSDRRKILM